MSHGARASPAPSTLMGALGSVGEDLRCHGTCAPVAMAGSAACAMAMGDGRTDGNRAIDTDVWDRRAAWPVIGRGAVGHGTAADER